jgi:ABC-2 type transport system ATP-binding protein
MEEADRLCKELYIIDHGLIVANGSPSDLKSKVGADSIKLTVDDGGSRDTMYAKAKQILSSISGVTGLMDSDEGLTAYAKNGGMIVADIVRAFDGNGIHLSSISISSPSLDDIFLQHTGRRIRPEELNTKSSSLSRFRSRRPARE